MTHGRALLEEAAMGLDIHLPIGLLFSVIGFPAGRVAVFSDRGLGQARLMSM
jgi:hypothetical protein